MARSERKKRHGPAVKPEAYLVGDAIDDDFRGRRRAIEVRPTEVHSVKSGTGIGPSRFSAAVRHKDGTIASFSPSRDFPDSLARLRASSPVVEFKGFWTAAGLRTRNGRPEDRERPLTDGVSFLSASGETGLATAGGDAHQADRAAAQQGDAARFGYGTV